ncbi:MAG: FMN-binding negative transcriptional regulator [Micrococcales bacterium]|nr:FMN-binding negative transcriptional regulator [Micrococcales bacterium]
MYVPASNRVEDDAEVRAMVEAVATAHLVTVGPDGEPDSTLLPILWEGDLVVGHMARGNPQWERLTPDSPALLVIPGPDAYVSPSWYVEKERHGRVVPTWNYTQVQLRGRVRVVRERDWLLEAVTRLTERHEGHRQLPWAVSDAPERYLEGMLRGIVGIEIAVTEVHGKAKLSQNRLPEDRGRVLEGLGGEADPGSAGVREAMLRLASS